MFPSWPRWFDVGNAPSWRTPVLAALGLVLIASAGCSPPPRPLTWTVEFETPALLMRAEVVRTEIREGGCTGPVRYSSDARPGEPGAMPPRLARGRWGFSAEAFSDTCVRFGSDCQDIDLPGPSGITSVITSVPDELACGPGECSAGACERPDAGLDAGVRGDTPDAARDAGRDAACADASRDGGPPILPYLPCGGTLVTDSDLLAALEVRGTVTTIPNFFHRDGLCGGGCTHPVIQLASGTEIVGHMSNVSEISLLLAQQPEAGSVTITACGTTYGPFSATRSGDPGFVNMPGEGTAPITAVGECDFSIRATGGVITIMRFDVACHPSSGPTVDITVDGMASQRVTAPMSAVLGWNVTGATSCEGMGAWSGPQHMAGNIPLLGLCVGHYSYALSCNYRGGTAVVDIADLTVE